MTNFTYEKLHMHMDWSDEVPKQRVDADGNHVGFIVDHPNGFVYVPLGQEASDQTRFFYTMRDVKDDIEGVDKEASDEAMRSWAVDREKL